MARMHARRKGKSGSKKPYVVNNPDWVSISKEEIEEFVVARAKEGLSTSVIGIILRDQYGVPDVKLATGKSITDILVENNAAPKMPEDLMNLMKKAVNLGSHLTENRSDLHNKRNLHLVEAKIRRLAKYYQENGVLSAEWKYSLADAKLMVE
ncbi:MAG: 30S ribosomal protein S15 [Candidatus Thermoplasmatota archaeon]|nr:30S ribosomal protein S15 [Candidatus Thermoplasmatota archaeon]